MKEHSCEDDATEKKKMFTKRKKFLQSPESTEEKMISYNIQQLKVDNIVDSNAISY